MEIQEIKTYVHKNFYLLFNHIENNKLIALFDNKGFYFSTNAKAKYDEIKNEPHLYVAWNKSNNGYYYIGKSFQKRGRWQRSHSYHLGTLAYHILDTIKKYDQNHTQWIRNWMKIDTRHQIDNNLYSIELQEEVYIAFIPFSNYANCNYNTLKNEEIKSINSLYENLLINSYQEDGKTLLNIHKNK